MSFTQHTVKHSGQVFTPNYLVELILNEAGYYGSEILCKHVIDNSCGDGAFICEIVRRYINEFIVKYGDIYDELKYHIETYIHGIELDETAYNCCLANLKSLTYDIDKEIKFDIINEDALSVKKYNNRMDFVIGNPPYVRVHNLSLDDKLSDIKTWNFGSGGMTDLYLVFFELGLNMLNKNGKLCYITPSSWVNSLAGYNMRQYLYSHRDIVSIIDLQHYQAFSATTYTMITLLDKSELHNEFDYYVYDETTHDKKFVNRLSVDDVMIDGHYYLTDKQTLSELKNIFTTEVPEYVSVRNGFCTLADKVFFSDNFKFTDYVIPVIKGSTGKWTKGFFPYDAAGNPVKKEDLFSNPLIAEYLNEHKFELIKNSTEEEYPTWYLYGRSQAVRNVCKNKIVVNCIIKDLSSIKINYSESGTGVYSGLYILAGDYEKDVFDIILTDKFVKYIAALKKYKRGGFYTFNTNDLQTYLNYMIHQKYNVVEEETDKTKQDSVTKEKEIYQLGWATDVDFCCRCIKAGYYKMGLGNMLYHPNDGFCAPCVIEFELEEIDNE